MTNKPTHIVYHARAFEGEGGEPRSFWTRVGAAWENKDGKGLSLVLDLLPADGRLVVRTADVRNDRPDEVQTKGEW